MDIALEKMLFPGLSFYLSAGKSALRVRRANAANEGTHHSEVNEKIIPHFNDRLSDRDKRGLARRANIFPSKLKHF